MAQLVGGEIARNIESDASAPSARWCPGFEVGEIDVLLGGNADEEDDVPSMDEEVEPVTRHGDLWILGQHRVFCGDALKEESYRQALGSCPADLVFTDPPYNVPIDGHVSGLGAVAHKEFVMASGEMTPDEFTEFLARSLGHAACHSTDGAIHFVCMDWRHVNCG